MTKCMHFGGLPIIPPANLHFWYPSGYYDGLPLPQTSLYGTLASQVRNGSLAERFYCNSAIAII